MIPPKTTISVDMTPMTPDGSNYSWRISNTETGALVLNGFVDHWSKGFSAAVSAYEAATAEEEKRKLKEENEAKPFWLIEIE